MDAFLHYAPRLLVIVGLIAGVRTAAQAIAAYADAHAWDIAVIFVGALT